MTRISDFDSIGLRGPRLKASKTELIGGSWSSRVSGTMLLNPQPAFDRSVSGEGSQDHASKVARNDATETQWAEPKNHHILWPLGANDSSDADTPSNANNMFFSIMAVAAWVAGGGTFYPSKGGSLSAVYTDYGRMAASSSEGSGVTCDVKDKPGWYVVLYATSGTEEIQGKVTENGRATGLDWNASAYANRGFGRDVVGVPYLSDTGTFSVEMWSSLASGYGVFIGVRKIEDPMTVVLGNEFLRWDLTDAQVGDRYPMIDMTVRTFGAVWSLMGGGFYHLPLPTLGYHMSDEIHLNQTDKTPYLHAQYMNQLLY